MALTDILDRVTGGNKEDIDEDKYEEDDGYDYEYEDALDPDPVPSFVPETKGKGKTVKPRESVVEIVKVTAKQKREIEDMLTFLITMPGATVSMKDPHCGGALVDNAEGIAKSLVPIICRNPRMIQWFISGTGAMDYIALAQALWPVGATIVQHHVTKTVGHNHEDDHDLSAYEAPRIY